MRNVLKKLLVFVIMLGMIVTVFPKMDRVSAAAKPAKPKITLTLSKDGASATLTIKKTKRAEGYSIAAKLPGAKKYTEIADLKLNGKKKRSYTLENLPDGEYSVKVRAYAVQDGKTVYGKYSKAKTVTIKNSSAIDIGIEKGDIIQFGRFEQDGNTDNGAEPIEWIVLSKDGGKLFLTSVYVLAPGNMNLGAGIDAYDDDENDGRNYLVGTWSDSGMRKWLNGEFLSGSFSEKEAAVIADTELKDAGCTDKVFLMSRDDVKNADYGFAGQIYRTCFPTTRAIYYQYIEDGAGGGWLDGVWTWDDGNVYKLGDSEACYWWTRTVENGEFYVVNDDGTLGQSYGDGIDYYADHSDEDEEYYIENGGIGIRPAMVINVTADIKNLITKTEKTMQDEWSKVYWDDGDFDDDDDDEDDESDPAIDIPVSKVVDISEAKKGDAVILGSYEQDGDPDNGSEPIEWIVLSRTDDELFVLSRYVIAEDQYNKEQVVGLSWEESSLRKWLNNDFYNAAFTKQEKKKIKTVTLTNSLVDTYKQKISKKKQNSTEDKIFLLSFEDVLNPEYGFSSEKGYDGFRMGIPSKSLSLLHNNLTTASGVETVRWWLRSLDVDYQLCGFVVNWYGAFGDGVSNYEDVDEHWGVRPAMVIKLK